MTTFLVIKIATPIPILLMNVDSFIDSKFPIGYSRSNA